jgi:hypothetical protein
MADPVLTFGTLPQFKVYVSDIGPIGPAGPQGDPGPAGTITFSGIMDEFEFVANVAGQQNFTVPNTPLPTGYRLFLNGLRQSKSLYQLSGAIVTIPSSLGIEVGDLVTFEYVY